MNHAAPREPSAPPSFWEPVTHAVAWLLLVIASHVARVRDLRRKRLYPADWRRKAQEMRALEHDVATLMADGVRRLLAGQPLDLDSIAASEPHEDFVFALAQSPRALALRIEALNRILADPERYVRRIAARLTRQPCAKATPSDDPDRPALPEPSAIVRRSSQPRAPPRLAKGRAGPISSKVVVFNAFRTDFLNPTNRVEH